MKRFEVAYTYEAVAVVEAHTEKEARDMVEEGLSYFDPTDWEDNIESGLSIHYTQETD